MTTANPFRALIEAIPAAQADHDAFRKTHGLSPRNYLHHGICIMLIRTVDRGWVSPEQAKIIERAIAAEQELVKRGGMDGTPRAYLPDDWVRTGKYGCKYARNKYGIPLPFCDEESGLAARMAWLEEKAAEWDGFDAQGWGRADTSV